MSSTEVTIRPPRPDEVDAVTALLNEHSRRLHGKPEVTAEGLSWYWEAPDVDLERDVAIAEDPGGEIVAYVDLGVFGDAVWIDLRGLEPSAFAPLLEVAENRAAEKKPGFLLRGWANETDAELRELYERSGYTLVRHSFRMEIDLDADVPEPSWPEDIEVRTFQPGDERLRGSTLLLVARLEHPDLDVFRPGGLGHVASRSISLGKGVQKAVV